MKTRVFESKDTNVKKFVFEFEGEHKAVAEAVLYRYGEYKKRTVICCSVMSGCPVGCTFCGTGRFFVRNLDKDEIVAQVRTCLDTIDCGTREIEKFQIMFMSMGEPMMNWGGLKGAILYLSMAYPNAQLLVSTSAPKSMLNCFSEFVKLSMDIPKVGLQFSVHESNDENRQKLIPTATCTLRQIASLGELWASFTGRRPFYNYCVHEGNDGIMDAIELTTMFRPEVWETTLSVICEKDESVKASIERQLHIINGFAQKMTERGASIRVFNPAGQDDIGGGCGQLWYFQEWLKKNRK